MQNCFIFCQLLKVQRHSQLAAGSSYCIGFVMKMQLLIVQLMAQTEKNKSDWKRKTRIGCFEVNTMPKVMFAMLLFFHFSSQNQKIVVFTLLSSVCSAVKKTRAEREASDFLCCTGNSQESQPARQHAGRCAVGRFVFSWAVIEGLWKTLSNGRSPAEFSANSAEPFGPEWKWNSFWSISGPQETFSKRCPSISSGSSGRNWCQDGLRWSGAVWQHCHSVTQEGFFVCFVGFFPFLDLYRKSQMLMCIFENWCSEK